VRLVFRTERKGVIGKGRVTRAYTPPVGHHGLRCNPSKERRGMGKSSNKELEGGRNFEGK
jgi:hypothetical protein